MGRAEPDAGAKAAHAHSTAHSSSSALPSAALRISAVLAAAPRGTRRSLRGDGQIGGNRVEIKRFTDEIAQRDHQIMSRDRASGDQFARCVSSKADLFFGP